MDNKLAIGTAVGAPGDEAVKGAWRLLAAHIGPFARTIAHQSMKQLSVSAETITQHEFAVMVDMMAEKLKDPAAKHQFRREAMALARNLAY